MKEKAFRNFLVSAGFATLIPLPTYLALPSSTAASTGAAVGVLSSSLFLIGMAVVMRLKSGAWDAFAFAGICPAAAATFAYGLAAHGIAREPWYLFGSMLLGIVIATASLIKNVDDLLPPKLLIAVPMAQVFIVNAVLG
jgi:hypothetical protein